MRRQPKCSSRPASTSWDPSPLARSDPAMSPAATLAPLPPAPLPSSAPVYGSSLSQSMNYANTWLYGTVSLKPQCRPGLMICAAEASGPGPGPPSFAIVMCNCPEFLIGTTRSKKSLCKKCGGARTTNWNMDEFANQSAPGIHNNLSRRYNTVRINRPITGFNMELDPYMLMRKSRFKTEKNDQLVSKNSNANRKSILECHVNPYDLIKFNKYYDTGQQAEDKKLRDNTGCKINKILDNTESVNTSSGSKKINKLLNKFKFKSSSNTPVPTSNISIAGHRININNKGDRAPVKISEEFVKDSSESEDFDEPEVDYSDHEFEHNTEREHPNQKSKQSSEQTNKDMKNTHNDSILLRQHQTNETTSDYSTRNKEYKSQSFNHYTDHNIFSQRKHSIPEIPRYQNKSNSNAVSRNHESNDSKHFEQSRNLTSNKVNDQVAINKEVNISNETNNNIENRLRNFKINESIISRHYDGNKRHSFDPYRMSELQKMMMHSEPNKRHSVCEAPNLAFLENSANDHESRSVNSQADNHNVGHLNRSNSQISTNSSHKSIHQDSDDGEDKIDLLETKIKPIPRISVRPVSNKFNTSTPVRPPRKSKSIDCTYRNPYQQITENENRKPRAYSMDRTNSINEMDLLRQNSQQGEDIVAIRTNKTDPVKKFKEKNQSKLNMSTFKYETTSDVSSKTAENQNVKRRVQQEDDDLDCNYILQSATKSKDKSKNQTFNTSQDTNSQQRRSSNTNPATFYRESKAAANYRTGSLTSDQMREIRAHFNARNAFTEKISNDSNTKSNQVTLPRAKHEPSPTKHKDTSPAPIDAKDNAKVSPNNTTDQDESSSDFMYDFFIHRNNKFNSISSTNSTEIKSILKKKLDEDIYNASVISSNDSTSGSSSVVTSSGIVTGDSSKVGGTRKKKQVQFEAAATAEDEPLVATIQKSSKISFEDITAGEETCAEEDIVEDNATGDLDTCADDPLPATVTTDDASDLTSATNKSKKFKLQRSESDRVPLKPTNEESNSFKDTMRIKTMRKHYNKDLVDKLLLRPKEPPPPPPKNQTEKKQMENGATPATKPLGQPTIEGALAMNEKLPRVNPRGSSLEDTNSENLVVSKAIHLKLIKNNPDYESIKLFNKYELPSIPEEQKLSPVLNKKETGSKFVVNDVQSALLKEINDKLRRMEEKRAKKENLYDDIIEDLGDDSTRDETMGNEQLETVLENTSDTKEGEQTETLSDDHIYDSPAEPYEIIELKPKLTLTMDNKEIKHEDKTENRNIKHTEQSAHLNSVDSCKAQPDRELMQGNEHDVKKEKELINKPKTYLGIQNENVHLPNTNNSTKSTKSLSPINASFHPKDTSTPIHTRVKSNIEELSSNISDKSSHQSILLNQSSKSVSTISVESNLRNTVADSKTHSSISTATTLGEKKSTVAATSNEMMTTLPKKSSGTSILINNTTNQNKSSIMITNNSGVSEPAQSFPTMPKFHIGPNGTIGRNSTKTPSTTKINCNVITINITPDVKDVNTNSSFTNFGQPVSEVILGTGATPNRTFVSHVNSNATNLGKPEDIYHSSNILIKHDLSQTYADFTPDDTMLDSLIEIPEHYQQSGVKEKIDTNDSSRTNHCDRRTENTNHVVNSKATEKENGKLVITSQLGNRNSALTNKDKTNEKIPNQARIDEINQTFSNLIKDNYDPIKAVKNKLVPHICKKENAEDEPVNKGSVESAHKENNASMENGMDLVKVTAGDLVRPMKIETAEDLRKVEPVATEITTNKDALDKLNADKANDSGAADFNDATSTSDYGSHYYMSSRIDTIIEDIEKEQEEEEDHYETIGEPIYDEIPPPLPKSSPPPLPLCPPPASLSPMSTNLKSIFEGASKSDILNYLVDAKQRFIDPSVAASHHHRLATLDSGLDSSNRSDSEYNSDVEFDFRSGLSHLGHHSDSSDCSIVIHEDSISLSSSDSTIRKEYVDIERNDSGVGSETSTSCRAKWQTLPSISSNHTQHECEDCDEPVHTQVTESGIKFAPLICEKCTKMRAERREIILEIIETEEKYGRDLQIIIDEFYKPMLVAGLLTQDQLESIFLNTEELLDNTLLMSEKLREAFNEGDDEMMTAHVGRIFIEAVPMLTAFQSYCTRQGTAALILANLEKEKELLRIFLRVSQMENSVLRRMNLNSFLMVPVQRVTKYPLLLARLYKVTPDHHTGKDLLIEAQHNIQLHLEHINSLARDLSTTKLWRKISMMNNRRVGYELEDTTYIKLRKLSVDVLDWNQDEVRFLLEDKLSYTQPTEHNWRRGRTIKLTPVNAVLVTLDKPSSDTPTLTDLDDPHSPSPDLTVSTTSSLSSKLYSQDLANSTSPTKLYPPTGVKEASLILLKEKNGRFALLREPLYLDKCIVYCDMEGEDYFELQEISTRDTFIFKADDPDRTKLWYRQLQCLVQGLGQWRKRRNALANIMMYSIQNRT